MVRLATDKEGKKKKRISLNQTFGGVWGATKSKNHLEVIGNDWGKRTARGQIRKKNLNS